MTKIKHDSTDSGESFRIMQRPLVLKLCPLCDTKLKAGIWHECRKADNGVWTPVVDPMPDGE